MAADQKADPTAPAPYRPPELARSVVGQPRADKHRPWLALRRGETAQQWHSRISRTCYYCGHEEPDMAELDRHEAEEH